MSGPMILGVVAFLVLVASSGDKDVDSFDAEQLKTGTGVDRLIPLVVEASARWQTTFWQYKIGRLQLARTAMCILWVESRGDPANYVGDGGLSVSCAQIYLSTAKALGLVPSDITPDAYIDTYANDDTWGVSSLFAVLWSKCDAQSGDWSETVRSYNGSGPRADRYRDLVFNKFREFFGSEATA